MTKQFNINPSKPASYKQMRFLAIKFSGEGFKLTDSVNWKNVNVAVALILGYHKDTNKVLTMGEVQNILEMKQLPKHYRDRFDTSKTSKTSKKIQSKKTEIESNVDDFEAELAAIG
jgi:hypothetical protein